MENRVVVAKVGAQMGRTCPGADDNIPKLIVMIALQFQEYTTDLQMVLFKWWMCKIHLNKAVIKEREGERRMERMDRSFKKQLIRQNRELGRK